MAAGFGKTLSIYFSSGTEVDLKMSARCLSDGQVLLMVLVNHRRVLSSKWFGLNCHSLNEQFDVPRDFKKNSILSWFCTLDKKTTLLNWIFNSTCLLGLVYIGQKLYFKTISAEFTTKTARYSPAYLNLTDNRKCLSHLLALCFSTPDRIIVISATHSYLKLANS